jgi:hypothetical protein
MTTALKSLPPESMVAAVHAYKRALALHNAPLPTDYTARQIHQTNYYQATETLRVALDRSRHRVPILETLETDDVPYFVIARGPAFTDDWRGAIAIRKELERLTWGDG